MATTTPLDLIAHSLAPGIALTSVIFFNTSLLNRFAYVTGRVRELTREARELRRATRDSPDHARLRSIRAQVDALIVRARMIRRTIMLVYVSLLSFIAASCCCCRSRCSGSRQPPTSPSSRSRRA